MWAFATITENFILSNVMFYSSAFQPFQRRFALFCSTKISFAQPTRVTECLCCLQTHLVVIVYFLQILNQMLEQCDEVASNMSIPQLGEWGAPLFRRLNVNMSTRLAYSEIMNFMIFSSIEPHKMFLLQIPHFIILLRSVHLSSERYRTTFPNQRDAGHWRPAKFVREARETFQNVTLWDFWKFSGLILIRCENFMISNEQAQVFHKQ